MKNFFFTTIQASVLVLTSLTFASCQDKGPRAVLDEFSAALAKKDNQAVIPFLTNEPDYVHKQAMKEFRRIHKLSEPTPFIPPKDDGAIYASGNTTPNYTGDQLLSSISLTTFFLEPNSKITKVVNIRENGKEALAKVELTRRSAEDGHEYAPLVYDILFYKEEKDGWKIFKVIPRHEGDEKFYEYNFYANPDYKAQ